jgi:hypothetical protein
VSVTCVVTSMQVFEPWILDAHIWISTWKFPLQISLRFGYLRLFQVLLLDIFLQVARGADLVNVNPKGERSVARLAEWLSAQYVVFTTLVGVRLWPYYMYYICAETVYCTERLV